MTTRAPLVAFFAAVLTILASPAAAQAPAPERKKPAPRKVIRLEELKVEGRIQKPQAMFLLPRANLNYGELDRTEPVTPKIRDAADRAPF